MTNKFDLDIWDVLLIALVKACVGNTNSNFRRIMLDMKGGKWLIRFSIFSEDHETMNAISEISTEFFSYGEDYGAFSSLEQIGVDEVSIGSPMAGEYHEYARVVFSIAD